jgi:AcrR family transcriptional regulator
MMGHQAGTVEAPERKAPVQGMSRFLIGGHVANPGSSKARAKRSRADVGQSVGTEAPHPRERILSAAAQVFQEFGYEGAAMTRIAAAARTTAPNVYTHFPSKQDLLFEVLERMYTNFFQELVSSVPDGKPHERLSAFVRHYVTKQLRDMGELRVFNYNILATALTPEAQRRLALIQREYLAYLRAILEFGVEAGEFEIDDVKMTSFFLTSSCEYVFTWYRKSGQLTIDDVGDYYARQALRVVGYEPRPNVPG